MRAKALFRWLYHFIVLMRAISRDRRSVARGATRRGALAQISRYRNHGGATIVQIGITIFRVCELKQQQSGVSILPRYQPRDTAKSTHVKAAHAILALDGDIRAAVANLATELAQEKYNSRVRSLSTVLGLVDDLINRHRRRNINYFATISSPSSVKANEFITQKYNARPPTKDH